MRTIWETREGLSVPESGEALFFKRAGVSACSEPIYQATEGDQEADSFKCLASLDLYRAAVLE